MLGGGPLDRAGQVFGRHVNHPGTKPNPFILESLLALSGLTL